MIQRVKEGYAFPFEIHCIRMSYVDVESDKQPHSATITSYGECVIYMYQS